MRAVVIGRNYVSRLAAIRAFGEAGYEVDVVATNRNAPKGLRSFWRMLKANPDRTSKYVRRFVFAKEPDREALIAQLLKLKDPKKSTVVLFPVDDYATSSIDLERDRLAPHFVFPGIHQEAGKIVHMMDKMTQKKLAQAAGLATAVGWTIVVQNGRFTVPEDIIYPCFIKPQISYLGTKTMMRRCDSKAEITEVLNKLPSQGLFKILVEQYIPIQQEYGVIGYCAENHVEIPCIVFKLQIGHGEHAGVTMLGRIKQFEKEFPDFHHKLQQMLQNLDYTGMVDVDLYESGGRLFFNELNLRAGAFSYAATLSGYNFPDAVIKALENQHISFSDTSYDGTRLFISEKVAWDDVSAGFMTREEYDSLLKKADGFFIRNRRDWKPEILFNLSHIR